MSAPAPTHRRFRWSLRAMLVLVTLVAVWLGYQVNWIRQRHALLDQQIAQYIRLVSPVQRYNESLAPESVLEEIIVVHSGPETLAPFSLRLFRENGLYGISLIVETDARGEVTDRSRDDVRRAQQLFPEAVIYPVVWDGNETSCLRDSISARCKEPAI